MDGRKQAEQHARFYRRVIEHYNFGRSRRSIRVNNGTLQFHGTSIGTITGIGTAQLTIMFNQNLGSYFTLLAMSG